MARKTSIFRELALAKALASGEDERDIIRRFADEWRIQRDSVRLMLKKFLRKWTQEPVKLSPNSLSPWKTSPETREKMNTLAEALASGQVRGDVVRKYAAIWELSTEWVDELITRVIAESQDEIYEQAQRELAVYVERIHAHFTRYADVQDWDGTALALDRLLLVTKKTGS